MRPLERLAREFTDDVNDLLNRTVTHGVRLSVVTSPPGFCLAGVGLTKQRLTPAIVPLTCTAKTAAAYLRVAFTLEMDQEAKYLTVTKSAFHVYADRAGNETLFHYDYDRVPANDYPNPHVQVVGDSVALAAIATRAPDATRSLGDLHFPVGGRRFRPTLEDVIELLVAEHIAVPRAGWEAAVSEHREEWRETQVKASVRRYPDWAAEALSALGYDVTAPPE